MLSCKPINLGRRANDVSGIRVYGYTRGYGSGRVVILSTGRVRVRVAVLCYGYGSVAKMLYPQTSNTDAPTGSPDTLNPPISKLPVMASPALRTCVLLIPVKPLVTVCVNVRPFLWSPPRRW